MLSDGATMQEVADRYDVTKQTIYNWLRADNKKTQHPGRDGVGLNLVHGYGVGKGEHRLVDPKTGLVIENRGVTAMTLGRMGDEKVTAFVEYHMEMMAMRQNCNKRDVPELYNRFVRYLNYCREHGIVPNNMNCYFAIGISRQDVNDWSHGRTGTPEHKEFADTVLSFMASVHEQGATDGVLNPISAMFWQKAHDNMIEASKLEVVQEDPLGEKRSAADIARTYAESEVQLPD